MSLQENSEIEETNSTDKDINIDDSQKKAKGRNSKRAKKGGKQKKCSDCGDPATRHDLCNRCRQKVESRTKRLVAQKFAKSGQCGSAFSAFLRRCVNFGLEPAKLTFFTTLSLMNQVFPIWHLRHESDEYYEDERGCKHSRWNMPDSHIEKVFGNLYKELRENPVLDGTEYSGDKRFNRNEINRILEQKLEQTLKEFGKLHQFSFSGNAYCSNENDNNNNTNEKRETRQRMRSEDNNNIHSRSNDRSNSNNNNNNNNNGMNNGLLCEGRRSFFRPTVSTQYISNNNMSSNVNGNIMNNAGITEGVNPFSFGLDMAPYVPRISYTQSNENNLMERENGPNGCGLPYSAPTSPMMRVQASRMGRMARMTTALPCIPQESPISSFEQSFSNLGNFAQNMRLANSNQSYENENENNNNNSSNNSNYFGSITPAMIAQSVPQCIAQNDGNGFENVYSSSNDESYDSSDGSQASQGMVSRNSSVNVNICNNYNYNYNGSIGNVDSAWDTSSLISFGGNSTVAHFNDMASLNSFHVNDNASVISIASPFGYNGARGSRLSSPVVSSNDMNNDNDNNNHNIIWGSPLPPLPQFEQLPNRFQI